MKYGTMTLTGDDGGGVSMKLAGRVQWSNPTFPPEHQFPPDPWSLRSAHIVAKFNDEGLAEMVFGLGAPADPPPLPDCGPWSLGTLAAHFESLPSQPVVTFWDGAFSRQVYWRGRRYDGTVGQLALDLLKGRLS